MNKQNLYFLFFLVLIATTSFVCAEQQEMINSKLQDLTVVNESILTKINSLGIVESQELSPRPNCINSLSKRKQTPNYKYELAICAIFQNEASYMKEWIEFHKLVGVQHFYLYNDCSTDNFKEVLDPYIRNGEVEVYECTSKRVQSLSEIDRMQGNAYMDCIHKNAGKVKWIAFIDLDEFIFSPIQQDLRVFLKKYTRFPAIAVNWQMFGTSEVKKIPQNKLMTELLVNQSEVNFEKNLWVKCIVQPSCVKKFFNPHLFIYKKKRKAVNSNFDPIYSYQSDKVVVDKIRINHYYTRDVDHFVNVKIPRRMGISSKYKEWLEEVDQMNKVYDDKILQFIPALREKMGFTIYQK